MKKLTFLFLMTLLPIIASAYDAEIDGIYYNIITKVKQATITSGDIKYKGDVIIPDTVTYNGDTYKVTSIEDKAFFSCKGLKSVIIPNSVTSIGKAAFEYCSALTSVIIGNRVTEIKSDTFNQCTKLTSVTIGNSVIAIGLRCFSDCSALTSVTIPDNVKNIGVEAFKNCTDLTDITIGKNMSSIGQSAFQNCPNLTCVYCYAKKIPVADGDVFKDSFIEYATIYVPGGLLSGYQTTEPWRRFGSFVALPMIQEGEYTDGITNFSVDKCSLTRYSIEDERVSQRGCLQILPIKTNGTWNVTYTIDVSPNRYNVHIVTLPKTMTDETATDLPVKYKIKLLYNNQDSQEVEIDCGAYETTPNEITDNVVKDVDVYGNYLKITLSGNANVKKGRTETSEMYLDYILLKPTDETIRGDVNGDGVVNGTDIQAIINLIVESQYDEKADVNEDGTVNGTDIQEVINIIVNTQ